MSLHGTHQPPVSPAALRVPAEAPRATLLEGYLTLWFLLATVLGGGLGFFVPDLARAAEVSSSDATGVHAELPCACQR